jgi:hypothetical protein
MPLVTIVSTVAESALNKLMKNTAAIVAEEAAGAAPIVARSSAGTSGAATASASKMAAGQADSAVKSVGANISKSAPSASAYDVGSVAPSLVGARNGNNFTQHWVATGGLNHDPVKLNTPQLQPVYVDQTAPGQLPLPANVKTASKSVKPQPKVPSKSKQEIRAEERKQRAIAIEKQRALDRKNGDRWQ